MRVAPPGARLTAGSRSTIFSLGMHMPPGAKPGRSAGVLLYRWIRNKPEPDTGSDDPAHGLEVYLVHPGGPYFRNKDVWGMAKGLIEKDENEEIAARREFEEETGFDAPADLIDLGTVKTRHGKVIHAFAGEWDREDDPPPVQSNTCPVQWPPRSGTWIDIPEVDEGRFFPLEEARSKMHGCQGELLDRLGDRIRAQ